MLESCITLNGVCYYQKCWNLGVENAKVVQGSSHDVMGAVAKIAFQTQQISDKNNTLFTLLKLLHKLSSKYLYNNLCIILL